jgi:Xaa-Pro aminopeptidase
VGDPVVFIELPGGTPRRVLILRDIEMERARRDAQVDAVFCPADFAPAAGLSGDRETATAQSLAEYLVRAGIDSVITDRTLPMIYLLHLQQCEIGVECDLDLGVQERRSKDAQEIEWLAAAQATTERAIEMACRLVAKATARADGVLEHDGAELTSERVRRAVDVLLLEQGFNNPSSIVAGGSQAADCHALGSGPLRSGQPVIIDIFPADRTTRYNGDCTRTVVHGDVPEEVAKMHQAVLEAKRAGIAVCKAGITGEEVHATTARVIREHGYEMGLPPADAAPTYCAMVHGTGHGIGLDVHEPPLLDVGGPSLVVGDAVTVEPGLYSHAVGGIRIEDMVIVEAEGCRNLNRLPEGLDWSHA